MMLPTISQCHDQNHDHEWTMTATMTALLTKVTTTLMMTTTAMLEMRTKAMNDYEPSPENPKPYIMLR